MTIIEWQNLMESYDDRLRSDEQFVEDYLLDAGSEPPGWFGSPGASPTDLDQLSLKLGSSLPVDYRNFLSYSNGWSYLGWGGHRLLSTYQVDWLAKLDPKLVALWEKFPGGPPEKDRDGHCDMSLRQ